MARVSEQGTVHKYERVRRALLADIATRQPHAALPTERDLAATYQVSRMTVRQALDALRADGVVYRVQGSGTFVAGPTISKTLSLTSFSEDMVARGLTPGSRLLAANEVPAGTLADELAVTPDTPLVRMFRVRLADGDPICLETVHLPAARVPGLLDADHTGSLYELLAERYRLRVVRAEQVVQAVVLGDADAVLLSSPPGSPALRVHRIGLDERDRPVEATTTVYRGDRYDLRFAITRD
ncbi:GntR family transcriptional regulator [Actinocatenispora rupis]|uniref:GntR family transcriptional regulator n=1 Tax=Actinocatenispora rupis TaxID=519421 RepID=A0A8J3J2J5_9ACTN|nr:GntR family transcriptional regulator [Actinocatenispora rupis]GID10396.1 GntR family transcriptional regulator [Actinocatenispora rupis]